MTTGQDNETGTVIIDVSEDDVFEDDVSEDDVEDPEDSDNRKLDRSLIPSWELLTMVVGLATGNPVLLFTVGAKALFDQFRPTKLDALADEFKTFAAESLLWHEDTDEKHSKLEEKVAELASAINNQPDLAGSEVVEVFNAVGQVYQHSWDPEKRQLVGAALRSCLLNREKFRAGLRIRYLSMLAKLTFADVAALAAIVLRDENLAEQVGISLIDNPGVVLVDPAARAQMHIDPLKECGLVTGEGSNMAPQAGYQVRNFWRATETAKGFLEFLEADPDALHRISSGDQSPSPQS